MRFLLISRTKKLATLLFLVFSIVCFSNHAYAQFATGGSSPYRNSIYWAAFGNSHGQTLSNGDTSTFSISVGADVYQVVCTLSNLTTTGTGFTAYRPGNWRGAYHDDLYNIGGTGTSNTLISGITPQHTIDGSYRVGCSATLNGTSVPMEGIVIGDAEQSAARESFTGKAPSGGTWRLIESYRTPGCTYSATATLTGSDLKVSGTTPLCSEGPMTTLFLDGASTVDVDVTNPGTTVVSVGAMISLDRGDAPASYGEPIHILGNNWAGGLFPSGTSNINTISTATQSVPALRLGNLVDGEGIAQPSSSANADDNNGTNDDDGVSIPSELHPQQVASIPVELSASGYLSAWFDWNQDGDFFDSGEQVANATSLASGSNLIEVSVPSGASLGDSIARFRLCSTRNDCNTPNSIATDGEVEDYQIKITTQPAFVCTKAFYNAFRPASSGATIQMSSLDLSIPSAYSAIGPLSYTVYNAIGYRTQDNYIYGIVYNKSELVRVGSDGSVANLGVVPGLPLSVADSGAFSPSGELWIKFDGNNNKMYKIDVTTSPATFTVLTLSQSIDTNDIAFNPIDGMIYAVNRSTLTMVDPTTGAVTNFGSGLPGLSGSHFFDAHGNFYIQVNANGNIYIVDIGTNGNGSGASTLIGTPTGRLSQVDGASCNGPAPVETVDTDSFKSVKLTNDADSNGVINLGDTVTYTIHFANRGVGFINNLQIKDQLPTGLTIATAGSQTITTTGSGSSITANPAYTGAGSGSTSDLFASGSTLGGNSSVTVTIDAVIGSGVAGTIGNQSSTTGTQLSAPVLSDNASQTSDLPASLQGGTFNLTVPAGSITQTISGGVDPTTIDVVGKPDIQLVKSCTLPANCVSAPQPPGTDLEYKIEFSNTGQADASNLVIVDRIPNNTDFKIGSAAFSVGTTGLTLIVEYSNDYDAANPAAATWVYTPVSGGGGADAGYDRNTKAIRWRVTAGTLSSISPNNIGDLSFTAKIR